MTIPFRVKLLTSTAKAPEQANLGDLWDIFADEFCQMNLKDIDSGEAKVDENGKEIYIFSSWAKEREVWLRKDDKNDINGEGRFVLVQGDSRKNILTDEEREIFQDDILIDERGSQSGLPESSRTFLASQMKWFHLWDKDRVKISATFKLIGNLHEDPELINLLIKSEQDENC